MSQAITLARPYARAAFQLAQARGTLPNWSALLGFAAQVAARPDVQVLFGHPKVESATLAALVQPPGDINPEFQRFLALLADNGRLALLPEIAGLYDQLRAEAERVVKAKVTSAVPMEADAVERIKASLKRRFGREVELATEVDPALIGGAVIDAGDLVIDGSLRTKLARLGAALAN
ncbi:F0F1 ATP synthase subunit delta [Arenimonas caeni]|jgi:F-type H+-transporting ATPase subunit delta|uniref:ATP synthase subunit delta n=1 Tax=Arenimonas caeni TaxID=2058085 RepID=A0A2P6M6S3_9GAMM|nr:F0F1 ATP synthase subunit delta [Arenimonas caeni]PRH81704.1 F0F1 ATP synthase subunit delta [Arenimonas caeni]